MGRSRRRFVDQWMHTGALNAQVEEAFTGHLVVRTFDALGYALGLALFQLFFIPTGIMYWLASRTAPRDLAEVDNLLRQRAEVGAAPPSQRPAPVTEASPS